MGKKKTSWIGFLIIIIFVCVFCVAPIIFLNVMKEEKVYDFGTSGLFQEDEIKATSIEIIDLFADKSYQQVLKDYAAVGANTDANLTNLKSAATSIGEEWGADREIIFGTLAETKVLGEYFATVKAEVVYEKFSAIFHLHFNDEMKLSGIDIQAGAVSERGHE